MDWLQGLIVVMGTWLLTLSTHMFPEAQNTKICNYNAIRNVRPSLGRSFTHFEHYEFHHFENHSNQLITFASYNMASKFVVAYSHGSSWINMATKCSNFIRTQKAKYILTTNLIITGSSITILKHVIRKIQFVVILFIQNTVNPVFLSPSHGLIVWIDTWLKLYHAT